MAAVRNRHRSSLAWVRETLGSLGRCHCNQLSPGAYVFLHGQKKAETQKDHLFVKEFRQIFTAEALKQTHTWQNH